MLKKDDAEHPVPELWRPRFRRIASAFAAGDFRLRDHPVDGVAPIDAATARAIARNIAAYGEPLVPLSDATWATSVCRWMDGYWQVLVDFSTEAEPVSDLTLHGKLLGPDGLRLEITSVHVP